VRHYAINQDLGPCSGTALTLRRFGAAWLFLLALLCISLLLGLGASKATGAQAALNVSVYLPLVVNGNAPSEKPANAGALIFGEDSFRSASLAVDSQGKMHVAFSRVAPFFANIGPGVFYGSCHPAQVDCGQVANWQVGEVDSLADGWPWVQLQVTADGRPRLLLTRTIARAGSTGELYRYAECNSNCALPQSWLALDITDRATGGSWFNTDNSYHNFALDNLGRPRFIYEDRGNDAGEHSGAYYVFCNTDCTQPGSWFETRIDGHSRLVYVDERASLIFTSDGRPRIFARDGGDFSGPDTSSKLLYLECNANCDNSAGWSQPLPLRGTGHGSSVHTWSPAVAENGALRLTFYPRGGPFYYMWCDGNCTQLENWGEYSLDFDESSTGDYSALALDSNGRPHIALRGGNNFSLNYLWCDGACETDNAQWNMAVVEPIGQIGEEHPITPLPTCVRGGWFGGLRPVIALDAQDNPRVAYDAEYMMECYINPGDPNDPRTRVETKWWTTRFVYFPRPEASPAALWPQPVQLLGMGWE
jgi:hypothetical protein